MGVQRGGGGVRRASTATGKEGLSARKGTFALRPHIATQPGGDVSLSYHYDNAEVTLNVCLGGGFRGGDLFFTSNVLEGNMDT